MIALHPPDRENLEGVETDREALSHSMLDRFLNCPRKHEWHVVKRLEPIARRPSLDMGRAFQHGIEHQSPNAALALYLEETAESVDGQRSADEQAINAAICFAACEAYLGRWPAPEGEERELAYRVRLRSPWTGRPSLTFDLRGRADGVIEHEDHLVLVENKLVSQLGSQAIQRLPLDRQLALMRYALWRVTGKPVREVLYRFTRKPSIRQKQGEQLAEFVARLEADYKERRDDFYTHEERLYCSAEDLLRIEAELWTWAEQMRHARKQEIWPRNSSACNLYGACPFIPLCSGQPDAQHLYQQRPEREDDREATATTQRTE